MSEFTTIMDAFPGSTWVERPAAERVQMALGYMRGLWTGCEGIAAFAVGAEPKVERGKYKHERFFQRFYEWPACADEAARWAITTAADRSDIYVCPMLRTERSRTKTTGAGGRWGWVDIDGPLTATRKAVLASLGDAVRVVSSGTGHHAYIDLGEMHTPEAVEDFNRSMVAVLRADAKWSNESLLRLPGTWNYKPVVFDRLRPALVQRIAR